MFYMLLNQLQLPLVIKTETTEFVILGTIRTIDRVLFRVFFKELKRSPYVSPLTEGFSPLEMSKNHAEIAGNQLY